METTDNIMRNMSWELLRAQKRVLIDIQQCFLTEKHAAKYETIEGILNLIDSIQDTACDELGVDRMEVFNVTDDESGAPLISLEQAEKIVLDEGQKDRPFLKDKADPKSVLRKLIESFPEFETDEPINGLGR